MISKEQYIGALTNEFRIIRHLAEKITPEQLEHKPTHPQRTLAELMQYLTTIFITGVDGVVNNDAESYKKYFGGPMPTLENFKDMMDEEEAKVVELLSPVTEEELTEEISMWGRTQSKAMHLLGLLQIASAYKMQLFLYMKQSGTSHINTMNLWAGMDQPMPAMK